MNLLKTIFVDADGISLARWRLEDAASLAEIGDDRGIADNMTDGFPSPYTLEKARAFIDASLRSERGLMAAIWRDGVLVGSIGASFGEDIYRRNASIGYFIGREHWGRGIASAAIRAFSGYLFARYPITRLYAEPFARNVASRKALEKAGFVLEALVRENVIKNDEVLDSCIYSCLKRSFQG